MFHLFFVIVQEFYLLVTVFQYFVDVMRIMLFFSVRITVIIMLSFCAIEGTIMGSTPERGSGFFHCQFAFLALLLCTQPLS
jgi:hypothetical protein